jgi:23S rRNA-/tRNA-specific pseudouridylate synthase
MVLFENKDVIVLNKICNISAQGGKETKANIPHLMNTYMYSQNQSSSVKSLAYLVHRLDKGTSGVMLVGKNLEAARYLVKQFAERKITKIYFAICAGIPRSTSGSHKWSFSGRITTNLKWNPILLRNEVISGELNDQMAKTNYDVVAIGRIDGRGFKYIGGQEFEDFKMKVLTGNLDGIILAY